VTALLTGVQAGASVETAAVLSGDAVVADPVVADPAGEDVAADGDADEVGAQEVDALFGAGYVQHGAVGGEALLAHGIDPRERMLCEHLRFASVPRRDSAGQAARWALPVAGRAVTWPG
jgi:hypothetical protein